MTWTYVSAATIVIGFASTSFYCGQQHLQYQQRGLCLDSSYRQAVRERYIGVRKCVCIYVHALASEIVLGHNVACVSAITFGVTGYGL